MCIICDSSLEDLSGLIEIDCRGCKIVTKIPNIVGLEYLYCSNTNIEYIPVIETLRVLKCSNTLIKKIPNIVGLERLYCSKTDIEYIPDFENLIFLNCSNTLIKKIPDIFTLERLVCDHCINLNEIPYIESLTGIFCNHSPITKIPELELLTELRCHNCNLEKLPILPLLTYLIYDKTEEISSYENLSGIGYYNNYSITKIDLKKMIEIDCVSCPKLSHISFGDNLKSLRIKNCPFLYIPFKIQQKLNIPKNNTIIYAKKFTKILYKLRRRKLCDKLLIDTDICKDVIQYIICEYVV